jgi:hypothetical protein
MSLVFDRPVRDITARSGVQTNCAGIATILADVEPAEHFESSTPTTAHGPVTVTMR